MVEEKSIPTGGFKRAALTGVAATKLGAKQLAHLGKKTMKGNSFTEEDQLIHDEELGKIVLKTLGMLRGTALKVSQALSQEAEIFPESMRKELAKACNRVIPLNRALILKVFQKEWGVAPGKLFESFDSKAFAAASLGQVHHAVSKKGKNVAVKIQYPGIASTISSDLKLMRMMLVQVAGRSGVLPRRDLLSECLDEVEERLLEEIDYRNEADNLKWFSKHIRMEGVCIPGVIEETSGDRILSMDLLEGVHLEEWLAMEPRQEERDAFGQKLFDFFTYCFYNLKRFHADPHSGNFLVLENDDLGVLDFGCVKQVDSGFPRKMLRIFKAIVENRDGENLPEILESYQGIGLFSKEYSLDSYKEKSHPTFGPMQEWLSLPYKENVYDFGKHPRMPTANFRESSKAAKHIGGLPRDYVFFDRAYNGVVNILRRIGARVETGGMLWG